MSWLRGSDEPGWMGLRPSYDWEGVAKSTGELCRGEPGAPVTPWKEISLVCSEELVCHSMAGAGDWKGKGLMSLPGKKGENGLAR